MEIQIAKTVLRKKNRAEESQSLTSDYTTNYSNQNSMVLAQTQTHRPMERNRELRNKPTHLW